jgi:hypothetical protein
MSTSQIIYLIMGIVFCIGGLVCGYFSYWANNNKLDSQQLASKDWLSRWIIKNRMLLFMCLFVIAIASGITFFTLAF